MVSATFRDTSLNAGSVPDIASIDESRFKTVKLAPNTAMVRRNKPEAARTRHGYGPP